jgi:hypothetical protein
MERRHFTRFAFAAILAAFAIAFFAVAGTAEAGHGSGGRGHGCRNCGFGWSDPWWNPWWGWGPGWNRPYYRHVDPRARSYGFVDLDVDPEEAEVLLDGQPIGIADDFDGAPDYLLLRPGSYTLEFRIPGFESWSVDLQVRRGRLYSIDTSLDRLPNTGRLEGGWGDAPPPQATRWTFGPSRERRFVGEGKSERPPKRIERWTADDNDENEADLDDGEEEKGGDEVEESDREDEPGSESSDEESSALQPPTPPEVPANPKQLSVRIQVDPPEASVWLDSVLLGQARDLDGHFLTTPGRHELVVMRTGFESRVLTIEAEKDAPSSIVVTLDELDRDN